MQEKMLHPLGKPSKQTVVPVAVHTFGGRIHVERNPQAAATPLDQLPVFIDYLYVSVLMREPWSGAYRFNRRFQLKTFARALTGCCGYYAGPRSEA